MTRLSGLLLLILCCAALTSAQTKSARERDGLNGPVRSILFEKAEVLRWSETCRT
jgi:hypothetical protein